MSNKVCIFVDGENLRHSLCDLFPEFETNEYLPKSADWTKFFDWLARRGAGPEAYRVRTYWYVVKDIDFTPFRLRALRDDRQKLIKILCRDDQSREMIHKAQDPATKTSIVDNIVQELETRQRIMEKRFKGWLNIQNTISSKHTAVEFRRAGSIRYNLHEKQLGKEKAVDVMLATDLVTLKDIYDVAIILSGDQDYVPAVDAVKNYGKRVISVAFKKEDGRLLPGGARRLGFATDSVLEIEHEDMQGFLNLISEPEKK